MFVRKRFQIGWLADDRGNMAVIVALLVPMLGMMVAGGVELAALRADRSRLQDAADAAALMAANQLALASHEGLVDRAKAHALEQAREVANHSTVTAAAQVLHDGRAFKVILNSSRPSFFGNLLPPGGFHTTVSATAQPMILTPVCVLGLMQSGDSIKVDDKSSVEAPGCAVHSNRDLDVSSAAKLTAAKVQLSGVRKGSGAVTPVAQTGAKTQTDPFAQRSVPMGGCMSAAKQPIKVEKTDVRSLAPGVHRGGLEVSNTARLTLDPGAHYFCEGDVIIKDDASLNGNGVGLFFHKSSRLKVDNQARVNLLGLKTGAWAGFLIASARDNTDTFEIKSVEARRLEGVIYLPKAKLAVDTTAPSLVPAEGDVSEAAKWTIAVVNELLVKGAPRLYINDDYKGSTVPVPPGITNNALRLVE